MHVIRFLIYYVMVSLLGVLLLVFLGLNHFTVELDLLAVHYTVNVAFIMVGAAAFGFIVALVLGVPGRLSSRINTRALQRDVRSLERLLADREDLLEDHEDVLADQEDAYTHLLQQHEVLMERHERMLLRHQALLADHSLVTAERDEARAQLAALHVARPAVGGAHSSGAAAPLRLLPPAAPVPARPVTPPPAARPATPVPAVTTITAVDSATTAEADTAPATATSATPATPVAPAEPPVHPRVTSGQWRLAKSAANDAPKEPTAVASAAATPEKETTEPAMVPVILSAPTSPAKPARPTTAQKPAVATVVVTPADEPTTSPAASDANTAVAAPPAWRIRLGSRLAAIRAVTRQRWRSARARSAQLRRQTQRRTSAAYDASAIWLATQAHEQRARVKRLKQRLTAG
jgi:uncharacterized integral membrane protein